MFSPDTNPYASLSLLNPRRRQRTTSEESVGFQHKPKRLRRTGLSSETFKPLADQKTNGYINHLESSPGTNGHVVEPRNQRHISVDTTSLSIRSKEASNTERGRKVARNQGSTELTKNDNYIITQLPATPDRLQKSKRSERWHGNLATKIGYAVATTHEQAIVWRYVQENHPKDLAKPLVIRFHHISTNLHGPLPYGLIVPTGAEPAFLLVMPVNGNIIYWDSLSSAASVDLHRQRQQATRGVVAGMMSGETIINVTEAEPHGFIMTLSTGRIAHMTVSDPQGRPKINVQFLRSGAAYAAGGLFGSLKSVFSSAGWKRDVAAVKAGSSWQRGQRFAVVATTMGAFQVWDLNWNGTHSLEFEVNAGQDLLKAVQRGDDSFKGQDDQRLEVLDFTILPRRDTDTETVKPADRGHGKLLILTTLKRAEMSLYTLVSAELTSTSLSIEVVHPISCYKTPLPADVNFRPRVLIPEPLETAFVVFETSVVLVSLVEIEESPSSQLQLEAHALPDPFQDVVDFQKSKGYRVIGYAAEPLDRNQSQASCVLLISDFGLIRITALPVERNQSAFHRATVTAKTKLEQAVFYGYLERDLLDFSGRPEISFGLDEVEEAALEVSDSIMRSKTKYIPATSLSTDQQLQRRSQALADLMKHLTKYYLPMSRTTRWQLLWNAEKMAACNFLWRSYDVAVKAKREGKKTLLMEAIEFLHEDYKTENDPDRFETDPVRHWFVHDVSRLEYLIPWAPSALDLLFKQSEEDNEEMDLFTRVRLMTEANELQLSALETAFNFRESNAALYGVDDERMMDGVLQSGYETLPEIWTCKQNILDSVEKLVKESRQMAEDLAEVEGDDPTIRTIEKLMTYNPRLVQTWCQVYIERFRWLKSRHEPAVQTQGKMLQNKFFNDRKDLFFKLSDLGLGRDGIRLAEKYHDMTALANIVHHAVTEAYQRIDQPGVQQSELEEAKEIIRIIETKIASYFTKFGSIWAEAYFPKKISSGESIAALNETSKFKDHLTTFFRTSHNYDKLSWINEVCSEYNYAAAADSLRKASKREASLWNKKIELSMGKLAILAAKTKNQANGDIADTAIGKVERSISVLTVQEILFHHIYPVLTNAIDKKAETELAISHFCRSFVRGKPTLRENLVHYVTKLINKRVLDPEDLIETITLMDEGNLKPGHDDFMDERFYLALKLSSLLYLEGGDLNRRDLREKIIWRRCLIQDDWEAINRTELKDDTQVEVETGTTALFKTLREGYKTDIFKGFPPPLPSSILGAGTTPDSLRSSSQYTDHSDRSLSNLARDLEVEDKLLAAFLEKGRLDMWWKGVDDAAKRSVRAETDRYEIESKRRLSMEKGFWNRMGKKDTEVLKAGPPDLPASTDEAVQVDGQGDVIMGE